MDDSQRLLDEARGMALASQSLVFCVIKLLREKQALTKAELNDLFEGVLQTLEGSAYANDPAGRIARVIIDDMAQIAATDGTLKPQA
jgi:hypothetical protein